MQTLLHPSPVLPALPSHFLLLPFAKDAWCESPVPVPRGVENNPSFGSLVLDGDTSSLYRAWSHCPAPLQTHDLFAACGHHQPTSTFLFSRFVPPNKLVIYHQNLFLLNVFEVYILVFLLLPMFAG